MAIDELKLKLKGLPKEQKLILVKQEIANIRLSSSHRPMRGTGTGYPYHGNLDINPPEQKSPEVLEAERIKAELKKEQEKREREKSEKELLELESLLNEIQVNVEAYESNTKRKELIPFMYDRDMNWYFNTKNIPNDDLVFETVNFIENERKGMFETLDFLNLLNWHYEELQKQSEKPFNYINHIRTLPVTEEERHLLTAMVLRWYGGIPFKTSDYDDWRVIKKILEAEFLKQFEGVETLEKKYVIRGVAYSVFPNKPRFWDIKNRLILTREEQDPEPVKYNFDNVKNHLNTLAGWREKIEYLIELQTNCKQQDEFETYWGNSFYRKCELEIKNLKELADIESMKARTESLSNFTLSKQFSKIDYIRIINVLYELRYFQNRDESFPNKKDVMIAFGNLVNMDLSNYTNDMNKAFNSNVTVEQNIEIFEKLKKKMQEMYLNNQNKPKK